MTDNSILRLFQALSLEPDDRVCIASAGSTQEFNTKQVPLQHADVLSAIYTSQKLNVWVMVNETGPITSGRGTVADVTRVRALWADLDVKDGGLPSWEAANDVISMLSDMLNCRPVAVVNSGHGLQPYWEVEDGEVSDLNRNFMVGVVKRWGKLVSTVASLAGGKVDNVYDLARVLRAPGTINYKDEELQTSLEIGEWSHPLTVAEVVELVESYGFTQADIDIDLDQVVSAPSEWQPADMDCEFALSIAREIEGAAPSARHPWLLGAAVKIEVAARNGCLTQETYGRLVELLDVRFQDLLANGGKPRVAAPGEVNTAFRWARARVATFSEVKVADNVGYHKHLPVRAGPDLPKDSVGSSDAIVTAFPTAGANALAPDVIPISLGDENFRYTDAANAERLANRATGQFRYVPGLGWHIWEEGRYRSDQENQIIQLALDTARATADSDSTKAGIDWAKKSMSATGLGNAVKVAQTFPGIITLTTQLDANGLELCTPGGIVDLKMGILRQADPTRDFVTRQAKYTPHPGTPTKFLRFLNMIFENDQEKVAYIKQIAGVILIGELRFHILPIFSGPGANGKSTLLDLFGGVLGDYAAVMPENFLLESGRQEHSTEIARLRGVRMAIGSETRPDGKFNESRVKMLTGEAMLSARMMRENFFDFVATHTLVLALNHPPQVKAGGDGFWRRIRKIDFTYQVPKDLRNPRLAQEILEEEGPQLMNWMVEGAVDVIQNGLRDPDSVLMSTENYRSEEDHIGTFLSDCTDDSPESVHTVAEYYGTYAAWCRRNGEQPVTNVALMRDIRTRKALTPVRNNRYRGWKGLLVYVNEE
jgi:P4 family phage/plasmid primase-like protien